ncbi:MAG: QueT transporter family protein [Limnochordia bacterium]|jgi:uncharacterized membrane protein
MLARGALIAALYIVLVWAFAPISFGAIQLRIAEGLTLLPILFPEAVPALFVGVLLSNIIGGLGPWDVVGGSLVTLLAAYVTRRFRHSWIAYASPILFNALLISIYLHYIYNLPYWLTAVSIGVSQSIAVLGLGIPLLRVLKSRLGDK